MRVSLKLVPMTPSDVLVRVGSEADGAKVNDRVGAALFKREVDSTRRVGEVDQVDADAPVDRVVAGAAAQGIVAAEAVQDVVAAEAVQDVVAAETDDEVIGRSAVKVVSVVVAGDGCHGLPPVRKWYWRSYSNQHFACVTH